MTPLVILQITSLMCFLYSLKIKMFKTNIIGFATISAALLSVTISLSDMSFSANQRFYQESFSVTISFSDYHFLINTALLLFITVYHTYKSYKRKSNV